MAATTKNAQPVPAGQGAKCKSFWKSTWANYPRLGARIKAVIVSLAMRDMMPARLATWFINRFGLRGA